MFQLRSHKRARVISISSGKGGVGKTSLAVNLAIALQSRGVRSTVVDLDLGLANADLLCGLNPSTRLDRAAAEGTPLEDLAVLAPGGFRLVPGSVGLNRADDSGIHTLARLEELDGCSDVVILDTGAGMGPMVRSALRAADLALLVATPEPTAIADAYALLKVSCQTGGEAQFVPMLVVNQCASDDEAQQVHGRIRAVAGRFLNRDIELLGSIPIDPAVSQAVRDRRPLMLGAPGSRSAAAVVHAAQAVIARLGLRVTAGSTDAPAAAPQGVWSRLARLIATRV